MTRVWERVVQSVYCAYLLRERLLIYVCASFHFGFEGGMLGLSVKVPDHCLSIYFMFPYNLNEFMILMNMFIFT